MNPPTPRQLEVLSAMVEFESAHGFKPGIPDLMLALGIRSKNCMWGHIDLLVKKGLVREDRTDGGQVRSRCRVITDLGYLFLGLPADRVIVPKRSGMLADGTVDVGQRCKGRIYADDDSSFECGVQLFGGLALCKNHRRHAA